MRRVAVANEKGGTAKSTTTLALGGICARSGRKVLLVDLDPQGSLAQAFHMKQPPGRTIAEVLAAGSSLADIIVDTGQGPHLAPASKDLAAVEASRLRAIDPRWQLRLRAALDQIEQVYDVTLVDCPPGYGALLVLGLAACDEVLVPVVPAYLDWRGIARIEETVAAVRETINPRLRTAGILPTKVEATVTHRNVLALLSERYGDLVLPAVRKSVAVADAPLAGLPLDVYRPNADATWAYRAVAQRLGLTDPSTAPPRIPSTPPARTAGSSRRSRRPRARKRPLSRAALEHGGNDGH